MDLGDLNKVRAEWVMVAKMKTDRTRIAYIKANPQMIAEVPFDKIRLVVRKLVKP